MTENDEAIDHYWSLNPRLFSVLDKLELHQNNTGGSPAHMLLLEIWFRASENDDDLQRLHLSFENVTMLKINPHGFIQVPVLEITFIQEHQWEGLSYRVSDTEENQLSFYCKQFKGEIVVNKEDINHNT